MRLNLYSLQLFVAVVEEGTIAGAAERDEYLVDPVHLAFVERFKPTLEKILVVDYETSSPQGS